MVREEKLSKQAVTVGAKQTRFGVVLRKVSTHKKKILIVLLAAVLVGVGAWAVYGRTIGKDDGREVKLLTESEADQLYLKKLAAKTPAADSSTKDKTDYYKQLEFAKVNVGDYKGAVDALRQREAIAGYAFTYRDYMRVADYYYRLKDNTAALDALDKAEAILPTANDVDTDYSRSDVLATINQFREALR
jgi:tetratricopeptide (TPR) repeat protein